MRIMTRYILIELTKVFLFGLTILTALMLIVLVVREALNAGLPPAQIARLIPFALPEALRYVIPVTLLLAITTVYSRMSGLNEVLAIKSLGISPMVIFWPALVMAFLLSLVTVWLNDAPVTWGRQGLKRVVLEAVEEIAYGMLKQEHRYNSPQFSINVKGVNDRTLIRPRLTIHGRGTAPDTTIEAMEAELHSQYDDKDNLLMKITLRKGRIEVEGVLSFEFSDVEEREIPLGESDRVEEISPSWLPLRRIPGEIEKQEAAIENQYEQYAAMAGYQMVCGDFAPLGGDPLGVYSSRLGEMHKHLSKLRTEPCRRWSAGFSCLCFAWIGVPMAIWLRNRDLLTSFFLCFAPILIGYYPLWAFAIVQAKNGAVPPIAVWLGNVVLVAWGAWVLRKVLRY
jgi:lipopolysaccharide export system permease protein